eukprot:851126-Amphidinium_carterae.1
MAMTCPAYDHRGTPIGRDYGADHPQRSSVTRQVDPWADWQNVPKIVTLDTHLPLQVLRPVEMWADNASRHIQESISEEVEPSPIEYFVAKDDEI